MICYNNYVLMHSYFGFHVLLFWQEWPGVGGDASTNFLFNTNELFDAGFDSGIKTWHSVQNDSISITV